MKREYPSTPKEAFELAVEGAYYDKELSLARTQGRIGKVPYDPNLLVHTAWDLGGAGGGDNTAIWFFQIYNNEIRLIDNFEGNGMSMVQIINYEVTPKPYKYGRHFLPHDAEVHEYTTGTTRLSTALSMLKNVEVVERSGISDGINQVRQIFPRCWFDEEKTTLGINALAKYSKKYIKSTGRYIDEPDGVDDHNADAFRYLSVAVGKISPKKATPIVKQYFNRRTGKMENIL